MGCISSELSGRLYSFISESCYQSSFFLFVEQPITNAAPANAMSITGAAAPVFGTLLSPSGLFVSGLVEGTIGLAGSEGSSGSLGFDGSEGSSGF